MKKILLLFIALFFVSSPAEAQWYLRSCDVTDIYYCSSEEFECLWEVTEKIIRKGGITTAIGVTSMIVGAIRAPSDGLAGYGIGPAILIYGGIITSCTGLIIWIAGADRRNELKRSPFYFLHAKSFHISPTINRNPFDHSHSLGITASITF